MPRRVPCAALVAVVLSVSLSACDSSEPRPAGPSSVPTTAALRTGIAALYAGDDATGEQLTEADCFADALLERLDAEELRAAGIVQDDGAVVPVLPVLDVPTAQAWVAAQGACADFVTVSTRAVVVQSKGKADPQVYETCLRDALTADAIDAALVDTLSGRFDSAAVEALGGAQASCSRAAQPRD